MWFTNLRFCNGGLFSWFQFIYVNIREKIIMSSWEVRNSQDQINMINRSTLKLFYDSCIWSIFFQITVVVKGASPEADIQFRAIRTVVNLRGWHCPGSHSTFHLAVWAVVVVGKHELAVDGTIVVFNVSDAVHACDGKVFGFCKMKLENIIFFTVVLLVPSKNCQWNRRYRV